MMPIYGKYIVLYLPLKHKTPARIIAQILAGVFIITNNTVHPRLILKQNVAFGIMPPPPCNVLP